MTERVICFYVFDNADGLISNLVDFFNSLPDYLVHTHNSYINVSLCMLANHQPYSTCATNYSCTKHYTQSTHYFLPTCFVIPGVHSSGNPMLTQAAPLTWPTLQNTGVHEFQSKFSFIS